MDITTVADDLAVIHDGLDVRRYDGLEPDTEHDLDGIAVRTLPRPKASASPRW
jgi:3',5'-cyclic-AMP phosphodiesterase